MRSVVWLLCIAGVCSAAQPWTSADLWNARTILDPRISPDGHSVVYLEQWNDPASNSQRANLRLMSITERQPANITDGVWSDRSPRWSPDSTRIAWISGHGGIRVREVRSAREWSIDASPSSIAWSADGRWLAYTAPGTVKREPVSPPELVRIEGVQPPRTALYLVPSAGGPVRELTDAQIELRGEPAWMPDGKSILAAAADGEIYFVSLADGATRRMTSEPGVKEYPLPAPNGSRIAWMSMEPGPHSYSVHKLNVMNADGTRVKALAGALDRDPERPQWSSDSRTIYFSADDSGATRIVASRNDTTLRQVTNAAERLEGFSLSDSGRAVAVRSTSRAVELISFTVDSPSTPIVLAAPMEKLIADREIAGVEGIRFPSAGKSVQGWLVKPPTFDAAKKYPLLLCIADTPRRMYGPEFDLRAQILATQGYLVLLVNPRGTPGYGEQFGRLLPTRYPGDDADDLLAGIDFVASRDYVDSKRIVMAGGLVAAWLLGHTDRFAAAVVTKPIVDFTLYATSSPENAARALSWMGTLPWDDPDQYVRHSPIYFAKDWKTPVFLVCESTDPQAEEMIGALRTRSVPAVAARLPDDTIASQITALGMTLDWLRTVFTRN